MAKVSKTKVEVKLSSVVAQSLVVRIGDKTLTVSFSEEGIFVGCNEGLAYEQHTENSILIVPL